MQVPTQSNSSDCGLFVIQYATTILSAPRHYCNILRVNSSNILLIHLIYGISQNGDGNGEPTAWGDQEVPFLRGDLKADIRKWAFRKLKEEDPEFFQGLD